MQNATDDIAAFDYISLLARNRTDIRLHEGKRELVRARLGKRMPHHGIRTLAEYCEFVKAGPDPDEVGHMVDAFQKP